MNRLITVSQPEDILPQYRGTPIGHLVEYHNLQRPFDVHTSAQLLIIMCIDNQGRLRIPDGFAYNVLAGSGDLRRSEFETSYAIAVGGVRAIALIGHNNCGMVNLVSRKDAVIQGLVERAGWEREQAEEHFLRFAPTFEIGNEVDFVLSEAKRLRLRYPKILVAPLLYRVEDNRLYGIQESTGSGS